MTGTRDKTLHEVLMQLEACKSGDEESYGKFAAADARFHGLIAHYSGNEVIAASLDHVRRRMIGFRMSFPDHLRQSLQAEHHRVFEALAGRNAALAFETMHAHIASTIVWVKQV